MQGNAAGLTARAAGFPPTRLVAVFSLLLLLLPPSGGEEARYSPSAAAAAAAVVVVVVMVRRSESAAAAAAAAAWCDRFLVFLRRCPRGWSAAAKTASACLSVPRERGGEGGRPFRSGFCAARSRWAPACPPASSSRGVFTVLLLPGLALFVYASRGFFFSSLAACLPAGEAPGVRGFASLACAPHPLPLGRASVPAPSLIARDVSALQGCFTVSHYGFHGSLPSFARQPCLACIPVSFHPLLGFSR